MQLNLALAWNRIDVAKSEIFTDETHWTVSSTLCCFHSRATFRHMLGNPGKVLDPGFHATDLGFQVLDSSLCQWNLDTGFQSLVGFRNSLIPKPRIPNSTSKNFTDSCFLIPLHGVKRFLVEFK